jgi:hypothetical protein
MKKIELKRELDEDLERDKERDGVYFTSSDSEDDE